MQAARSTLLMLTLLAAAAAAEAGNCRASLRPVLLQADPDAARITEVRALCAAEAEAGDADALYQLALTELGLAGRFEPATAVPRIREAAEAGVSEAQYWLAWQSESGPLLDHDADVARGWYERAAASRHRLALQRLADAYERGELNLKPDPRAALALRAQIRRCDQ